MMSNDEQVFCPITFSVVVKLVTSIGYLVSVAYQAMAVTMCCYATLIVIIMCTWLSICDWSLVPLLY